MADEFEEFFGGFKRESTADFSGKKFKVGDSTVLVNDNTDKFLEYLNEAVVKGLTAIGIEAEKNLLHRKLKYFQMYSCLMFLIHHLYHWHRFSKLQNRISLKILKMIPIQ